MRANATCHSAVSIPGKKKGKWRRVSYVLNELATGSFYNQDEAARQQLIEDYFCVNDSELDTPNDTTHNNE